MLGRTALGSIAHHNLSLEGTRMTVLALPADVEAVVRAFRTCEFATLAKDGTPVVWPTTPLYRPKTGQFLVTTSIGLPQKAFNARRNPRVSLLFSNPTASGLESPPAVLIQGDAQVSEDIHTWDEDLAEFWPLLGQRQPASRMFHSSALMRYLCDWYFMRLLIYVTPRRIRWWPAGHVAQAPQEVEVSHVG